MTTPHYHKWLVSKSFKSIFRCPLAHWKSLAAGTLPHDINVKMSGWPATVLRCSANVYTSCSVLFWSSLRGANSSWYQAVSRFCTAVAFQGCTGEGEKHKSPITTIISEKNQWHDQITMKLLQIIRDRMMKLNQGINFLLKFYHLWTFPKILILEHTHLYSLVTIFL